MKENIPYPKECNDCGRKKRCVFPEKYYEECPCPKCIVKIICSEMCDERAWRRGSTYYR